jgi:hypothetical protein
MGLLGDLANMALGQRSLGAARVALPPRFAPRPALLEQSAEATLEAAEKGRETAVAPAAARSVLGRTAPLGAIPAAEGHGQPPNPEPISFKADIHVDSTPSPEQPLSGRRLPRPPLPAATPPLIVPHDDQPSRDAAPPAIDRAVAAPLVSRRASTTSLAAPLSPSARAARTPSSPQATPAPTIVHVTIDRIDVRAPAASPSLVPTKRARPQPAVSLADYLAEPRRRG